VLSLKSLVSILRGHLARSDDARTLIRQIFETEADLLPDPTNKILTLRIHHLTQAAHDQVLEKLCVALNETQTVFPGTDLTLIFKIGSSQIPPGGSECIRLKASEEESAGSDHTIHNEADYMAAETPA